MKKSSLLSILLLSVLLPAITHAANYQINIPGSPYASAETVWATSAYSAKQIAVSNGVMYGILPDADPGIAYYNTTTGATGTISTGTADNGLAITNDENRNIALAYNIDYAASTELVKTVRVYKAASAFGNVITGTEYKDIDISTVFDSVINYTHHFTASGNLWEGTGYLYFTDGATAVRVTVTDGAATLQQKATIPTTASNTTRSYENILEYVSDGNFILQIRESGTASDCPKMYLDCKIDWANSTFTLGTAYSYYMAAAITTFRGHEIFVHPTGTRNTATSGQPLIVEVDRASQTTITSHPNNSVPSVGVYGVVNAWTEFEMVDDNTLGLYVLSPKNGTHSCVSRYNITATELTGEMVIPATPTWTQAASGTASTNAVVFQQPAVSPNGYLYLPGGNNTNYSGSIKGIHVFGNGVSALISSGGQSLGFGGAFDDNNHYVLHGAYDATEAYDAAPTTLRVRRPLGSGDTPYLLTGTLEKGTSYATISLGDYAPGIVAKYFDATGDMATKGHVWWIPNETHSSSPLVLYGTEVTEWAATKKLAINLKSLFALEASSTGNNYIQFYDTSDATRYRALLQLHGNGLYDVVINVEKEQSVSVTRIPDSSVANYMNTGAHIFMLNGHKLLARSVETSGVGSQTNPTRFEIVDITDINNITTLAVIQPSYGNNIVTGGANVGTWLQSRKTDEKTVELWAYGAGCGVEVYTITANIIDGASITLSGTIQVDTSDQLNRQDAVLSWTAPSNYDVEEYKVYCTEEYTSTSNTNTLDKTYYVGSTTGTTLTHKDLHWIKGSTDWYKQTYTYTVYPVLADGKGVGPNATVTLTPDFLPCPPVWVAILTYDGYQNAQIYWTTPSWGQSPNYYNVYRDGVKLNESPIQNYNYLDTKISSGEHTYHVEGIYIEDSSDLTTATLTNRTPDRTATIAPRNPTKSTYSIETVYNYLIGSGSGEVQPQGDYSNMGNKNIYAQAEYYRGHWYLAQLLDANGSNSGILKLSADKEEILTETATAAVSYSTSSGGWSRGMAMDDGGNIFVRRGGIGSDGNYTTTSRLSFGFELGAGAIYLRNADGSYSSTPVIVDLSKCQILDFDSQYARIDPINGINFGRTEYFNMSGDLSEVGGEAYLWVSASASKRSNKIKLTRTSESAITASLVDKVDITLADRLTRKDFAIGVENYVFPVKYLKTNDDGTTQEAYRGDYIHNLRSRVYANIKPTDNPDDLTDVQGTIYDTQSRVNQAGGTTIGWNGEIFLITPQCVYSQNTGNFYVSMGDRAQYDESGNVVLDENSQAVMLTAEDADLTKPIPVGQVTQDELSSATMSNANGNWIYATLGKIDGDELYVDFTDPDEAECVYIYQYIPGGRFAKYRLISNSYFPPTPVDLEISSVYGETGYIDGDLVRYDGIAKFGTVIDSDTTNIGNVNYNLQSYTYVFKDVAGTDVWTYSVLPNGQYAYERVKDGVSTTGTGEGALVSESYTDMDGTAHAAYFQFTHTDLKRDVIYQSSVTVRYVNASDSTDIHTSETTVDEATRNYTPVAATPESVTVYTGQTGTSVEGVYRVEINFDAPGATVLEEPVSYYRIVVGKPVVDADSNITSEMVTDTLSGFELMINGKPDWNSGKYHDYIPGNYDFQNNEGTWSEGSETSQGKSTLIYYHTASVATYSSSSSVSNDPKAWEYSIEAVYGGSNPNVMQSASVAATAEGGVTDGGTTSNAEIEKKEQGLNVYPVPATTVLTVNASEAIHAITVYDISGAAVMSAEGDGGCSTTLDVSPLAPGYYMLEINHGTIVRFVKE